MKMIDVDMSKIPHHLHLICDYKIKDDNNKIVYICFKKIKGVFYLFQKDKIC